MLEKKYLRRSTLLLLFLVICYFPIFHNLDHLSLRLWDESIFATSAIEMEHNGNYLVQYRLHGEKSSKPPLMNWLQILSMKIFGYNELAIRLPSALFALFTALLIVLYLTVEFNMPILGYLSGMVLITSGGFIDWHVARTGDHDSALIFFLTSSLLFFYKFIHDDHRKKLSIGITTSSLIAAVLTKSASGLFLLPAMFLYLIQQKKFKEKIILKYGFISILIFNVVIGSYYVLLEIKYPGHMQTLFTTLTSRYFSALQGHSHDFLYYLSHLKNWQFTPWIYFIPISCLTIFLNSFDKLKQLGILILISTISYFLIISFAKTKLVWYIAPVFPLASILVGIALYGLYIGITNFIGHLNTPVRYAFLVLFLFTFFFKPYSDVVSKVNSQIDNDPETQFGYFMKKLQKSKPDLKEYSITEPYVWNYHIHFYMGVLNHKYGYIISLKNKVTDLHTGEITMACNNEVIEKIYENWALEQVDDFKGCILVRIKIKKVPN